MLFISLNIYDIALGRSSRFFGATNIDIIECILILNVELNQASFFQISKLLSVGTFDFDRL